MRVPVIYKKMFRLIFIFMSIAMSPLYGRCSVGGEKIVCEAVLTDPKMAVNTIKCGGNEMAAVETLKEYWKYEEKEQYDKCYDFLSMRFKKDLSEKEKIKNAEDYKYVRDRIEAHWFIGKVKRVLRLERGRIEVYAVQTVKGEGDVEIDARFFVFVKEGVRWKIDSWENREANEQEKK